MAKKKQQKEGRRDKIASRIKPYTHQRHLEGSNKPCGHQDPETPQRPSQNCVWVSPVEVWVSSGLPQGHGLWVQQTWVWHKPSWRRSPLTPPQSCQNLQDWEINSWRAQTKPCTYQDPEERSSDDKRDWPILAHECWGVSGRVEGCWGTRCSSAPIRLFEGGPIIFTTSMIVWPQVKKPGGNTALPINRKLD